MEDEAAKLDSNNTSFSCHCTDARQRSSVICCIESAERFAAELTVYGLYDNLLSKQKQDELLEVLKI